MISAELNPYDPPRAETFDAPPEQLPDDSPGLWRHGEMLVMHRAARFPFRCIMTNEPADAAYPWDFGNWQGRSTLEFPLAQEYVTYYRSLVYRLWGGWLLLVLAAFIWETTDVWHLFPLPLGPAALVFFSSLVVLAIHLYRLDPLRLDRSEGNYYWIRGIHPDFLADLPEWPYDSR